MITRVGYAMRKWQNTITFEDEACCANSHEFYNSALKVIPKPDEFVCERERAWREYVRIRDNNPRFPFDVNFNSIKGE